MNDKKKYLDDARKLMYRLICYVRFLESGLLVEYCPTPSNINEYQHYKSAIEYCKEVEASFDALCNELGLLLAYC